MATNHAVADVLDETIHALSLLDLDRLQMLEKRVSALTQSDVLFDADCLNSILAKKRLLKLVLQNCELNLDTLNRLHGRNTRDQWAR